MNDAELLRYSRHILLPGFDVDGQERVLAGKVLVVGLGGLGCPVALYLAAAGVGTLWLADFDRVDASNLQRQIAHFDADIGRLKVHSAADKVHALNAAVRTVVIEDKLAGEALDAAVAAVDVVVDCSDTFATRFALNATCWRLRKPLVSGAAIRGEGQLLVVDPGQDESPCYRCLYDDAQLEASASCAENGVIAPLVGVIGSLQALEVLKLLAGFGKPAVGKLQVFDAALLEWRSLRLLPDPTCPVCSVRA